VTALVLLSLGLAALPALMYMRNARLFRPPFFVGSPSERVSVLIPARNEERAIAASVGAVQASTGVEFEVVVLDDHSEDGTADVVLKLAAADSRVRLEPAPTLPPGWCGKQHACFALSKLARHDVFVFLDADVRLAPDALARTAGFLRSSAAGLVSGFPRQETGTLLEKLVLPLINWLIVCYLPIGRMRQSLQPGLGAGCGQLFVTTRAAYDAAGGHAAVKASLHDGVTLPRAYRRAGMMTDICDATDLATCRMYGSAGQVWFGLAKNAREGLGAWPLILLWTLLLAGGHVLPFVLLAFVPLMKSWQIAVTLAAVALSVSPRLDAARRFRASRLGAVMHPVGVAVLLAIQWYATVRAVVGKPVGWKGRPHPAG
jgi:glycosyltransferase involved in cell wall biosynthesis